MLKALDILWAEPHRFSAFRRFGVSALAACLIATAGTAAAQTAYPWFGLVAPSGTPQPIIDKLYTEAAKGAKAADVRTKLNEQGFVVVGSSPAEMAAFIKSDTASWAKLINAIGLKLK